MKFSPMGTALGRVWIPTRSSPPFLILRSSSSGPTGWLLPIALTTMQFRQEKVSFFFFSFPMLFCLIHLHYGPKQPRIQIEVLGHLLVHSLVRSHRSLVGKCIIGWLFNLFLSIFDHSDLDDLIDHYIDNRNHRTLWVTSKSVKKSWNDQRKMKKFISNFCRSTICVCVGTKANPASFIVRNNLDELFWR